MADLSRFDHLPERALAVRQPWADCILHYGKDIENREVPWKFRGRVCIHASKREANIEDLMKADNMYAASLGAPGKGGEHMIDQDKLSYGGIIGTVEIAACVLESGSSWFEGPYGFVLRDPQLVPFIPVRGALQTEVIRHALRLYEHLVNETADGSVIAIRAADGGETIIVSVF